MTHPTAPDPREIEDVIAFAVREARSYLATIPDRPARQPNAEAAAARFAGAALPDDGAGATAALTELVRSGLDASVTNGPRFFHFVIGGSTPAAFGADWIATTLDQCAYAWVSSPLAIQLEVVSLEWLKDLLDLPRPWAGVFTTGATAANFVCLGAARQWWGSQYGVDVSEAGLAGLPSVPVFSSGHLHASSVKALSMLGMGRAAVKTFSADPTGRADLAAIERALRELDGAPAILIGNAGEVNAGDFDPLGEMADLARANNAWLHVDGAFGLFARVAPSTRALTDGVERAHSVTVDGHKWMNVPYDCGFAFVEDVRLLARTFAYSADYLPQADDPHPNMGILGPESSRRARSLSVWASLRAYGRSGFRAMIENHIALAHRMAELIDAAPDLERLADVRINIVCFRYNPGGVDDAELDELNTRLGDRILQDGRVYVGTTRYCGQVAFRPAIANWRIGRDDVAYFVSVVRELGDALRREWRG